MGSAPYPLTSNRARLESALDGQQPIYAPVYAAYAWFVSSRPAVDWRYLFAVGLGQIQHAALVEVDFPHLKKEVTESRQGDQVRRDVRWITDRGELHEYFLGEWQQEHVIKSTEDYRIMARALSDAVVRPTMRAFEENERTVGDNGITLGTTLQRRTAFQKIQVDYAGLEQFSVDIAMQTPELLELLGIMNDLTVRELEAIASLPVKYLKLWENLSVETMGPRLYRQHLVPVYQQLLNITRQAGQRLCVHYDGHLRAIAKDIAALEFHGIDSFTEPPEGDMMVAEARRHWPEKFLWLHPNLGWYALPLGELAAQVKRVCAQAGDQRYCLMISEDIPTDWRQTVPRVLETLNSPLAKSP